MQGKSALPPALREDRPYTDGMPRKLSKPRPRQGAHLAKLRLAAGLSQVELAKLVGEKQQNIAFWEQCEKPPRSDVLPKMAEVLGVSVEQLLRIDAPPPKRGTGPVGMVRKVFDEVSKLPRRQQQKIVEFVSALLDQYKQKAS
jgi:transcriptional regulator with XRE-family HTH domain